MDKDRLGFCRSKMEEVMEEEGASVTFVNSKSGKRIRFAGRADGSLRAHLDLGQLSKEEIAKLLSLGFRETGFGEVEALSSLTDVGRQRAIDLLDHFGGLEGVSEAREQELHEVSGVGGKIASRVAGSTSKFRELISEARAEKNYNLSKVCDLEEAVELTARFFEEVCSLPGQYEIRAELRRGEIHCDACGRTIKDDRVVRRPELSIEAARQMGMEEDRIQVLVERHVAFTRRMAAHQSPEAMEALCSAIREVGPVIPVVCAECAKRL